MKLFKTSNMEIVNYCRTNTVWVAQYTLSLKRRFQNFIVALQCCA